MFDEFVDTHCHLFWEDFRLDLADVLKSAREQGVRRIIVPATNVETMREAASIAEQFAQVFFSAGIHPHDTSKLSADSLEAVRTFAAHTRCIAIGEIGLDYHYDYSPKQKQWEALHAQLAIAAEFSLPVILHNRESDEDLLSICSEHQHGSLRGQFHCFSSSPAYAERVLDAGFHVSFTGNVTYKKSTLSEALCTVPDNRLLIETDAPFMTPVPHRGARNEPGYIPLIAAKFAEIRGTDMAHIARITTRNAEELFSLPPAVSDVAEDESRG